MMLCEVSNNEAIDFLKQNAKKEYIFIRSHERWIGWKIGSEIVHVTGMDRKGNGIKVSSMYTLPQYRRMGIATIALQSIISENLNCTITGYFNTASQRIPERLGFEAKQILKNGTKLMIRRGTNV